MSSQSEDAHRKALDDAEEAVAKLTPASGPVRRGAGRMWNPQANPVRVHAPKDPKRK